MSPSRGYRRDGSGRNVQGGGGYGHGYGNGYVSANVNANFANAYGNAYAGYGYADGYTNGNGYSEYEQYQYQHQHQYQPEQYQPEQYQPEQYQSQQYQQQYSQQQYPPQYQQYHDASSYDTYNAQSQHQHSIPQRRPSPSYAAYNDSSAARRRPFAQSSRGYSTYSSSSTHPSSPSSSSRRPAPPRRPQPPSEQPLLMPASSAFGDLLASRAGSRSPRRFGNNSDTNPGKRSSSPPPQQQQQRRTEPREEYLRASLAPSWHVDAPASARKLIVLDLNGSLLLRSAHQKRAPLPRYGHHHGQSQEASATDPYADPYAFRPVRTVHPRPYLSAFVAYILHPATKTWLDTMVWSSAQPHSVDDMVERCFKERRQELRAVWARDTLGLSGDEYYKKSLTLKDLEKPWAELPIIASADAKPESTPESDSSPSSSPLPSSPPASDPTPTAPSASSDPTPATTATPPSPSQSQSQSHPHTPPHSSAYTHHSALSTLLIDDSPLKAALQPWNHLVIREYVQEVRRRDLEVAEAERGRRDAEGGADAQPRSDDLPASTSASASTETEAEAEIKTPTATAESTPAEPPATDPISTSTATTTTTTNNDGTGTADTDAQSRRTLKRLQKKEAGKLKRAADERARAVDQGESPASGAEYDQTLLAVVGILDRVRWEGNVAGWMRGGGLVSVEGVDFDLEGDVSENEAVKEKGVKQDAVALKHENKHEKPGESTARTRTHTPPTRSRDASPSPGPPSSTSSPAPNSKKRRRVGEEGAEKNTDMGMGMDTSSDVALTATKVADVRSMDTSADGVNASPAQAQAPETATGTKKTNDEASLEKDKEKEEQTATGVPTISEPTSTPTNAAAAPTPPPLPPPSPKLWYEHREILAFWAERGRKALGELGIEVQSGIVLNGGGNGNGNGNGRAKASQLSMFL
ncbi:hypothetical protein CVT25_000591 [Psilocybe cyanescens]|uniref:FCP1 homology domain-containing protein n=1 Tax=Psilocybe cyanescens TaxID=93625 RepID=A0A409XM44_PSICY|nr:hypothetical protein CVT25_000591 [Psilocybe cyanescens]